MLLMRLAPEGMYHGGAEGDASKAVGRREPRTSGSELTQFEAGRRKVMFGTLTLIKRNGSEGSTMTMDSRETTIGR